MPDTVQRNFDLAKIEGPKGNDALCHFQNTGYGLSISDAIRLLMLRIADEQRLPFAVKVPSTSTRAAITELEAGKGKRLTSVVDLMTGLHESD